MSDEMIDACINMIRDEKGDPWVIVHTGGNTKTAKLASLVYHHFRETEEGRREWSSDLEPDDKADRISGLIYDRYVTDGNIHPDLYLEEVDEKGMTIDNYIFEMVSAGVA